MNTIPSRILADIQHERDMQDARWGGPRHDDTHTEAEWVGLLCRHIGLAIDDGDGNGPNDRWRKQLIRVAALAVAAVESYDRRRERVAGPVSTGSGF